MNLYMKAKTLFAKLNEIKPRKPGNRYTSSNLNNISVKHLVTPGHHVYMTRNGITLKKARTFANFKEIFNAHPKNSGRRMLMGGIPPKIYVNQALAAYGKPLLKKQLIKQRGRELAKNIAMQWLYHPGGARSKTLGAHFRSVVSTMRPKTPSPRKSPSPKKSPSPRKVL